MGSEATTKLVARVRSLESLLSVRDVTIREQEELIDQLRGRVENQQSTLAHRMQCINKFQKERDDLRRQNAQLIAKLAEVGRKQSVTSSSPPQVHRIVQRASTFQGLASSEEHNNNNTTRHHQTLAQKSASLPLDSSPPQSSAFHPPPPPASSSSPHLTALNPARQVHSPLPPEPSKRIHSETVRQDRFEPISPPADSPSSRTVVFSNGAAPKDRALPEPVKTVRSSPPEPTTEDSDTDYSDMEDDVTPSPPRLPASGPVNAKRRSGLENGVLPAATGGGRVDPRVFSEPISAPHIHKGSPTVAVSRTKAVVSPTSSLDGSPSSSSSNAPKRSSGSEAVAKQIKHIIKSKTESSSPDSSPNSISVSSTASVGSEPRTFNGDIKRGKSSPLQHSTAMKARGGTVQEHKPLSQVSQGIEEGAKRSLPRGRQRSMEVNINTITLGMLENVAQEASMNSQTNGSLFDDIISSEVDSSFEMSSPPVSPVKQHPLKSAMKKSPSPPPKPQEKEQVKGSKLAVTDQEKVKSLRRFVTLSDPRYKANAMSVDGFGLDDSVIVDEVDGEEQDELGDMNSFQNRIRKRTKTLAVSSGRDQQIGRKNKREIQREVLRKRNNSLQNINSNQLLTIRELELFSPDMEARIRDKICNSIGEKYGGRERATKAAITIQHAYRQYKIQRRFIEMRKGANPLRKRALSLRDPRRRPSIMRKKEQKYRRELSSPSSGSEQLQLVKQASTALSKERPSHAHSGSRSHLVQQKRSQQNVLESLPPGWSPPPEITIEEEQPLPSSPLVQPTPSDENDAQTPMFTTDGTTTSKSTTDATATQKQEQDREQDEADTEGSGNLPTSFSSDQILGAGGYERPLSVFSEGSVTSSYSCQELKTKSLPPGGLHAITGFTAGEGAANIQRILNVGVNHFNRKPTKGIQYLVCQHILEDDPRSVAKFLMEHYGLSKEKIGDFLGEINNEFNMAVLECLVEQMNMGTKPIDEALRLFQQIFRMPGEAQKIDKIMEIFALEYYKFNKGGAIQSEDAAYILSFAIMMLHTALHNPSVRNRTTKKQWVSMNRGCNDGSNYPEQFLLDIYDRIQQSEFTTGQDHTQEVAALERQILGYRESIPRLSIPSRHFLLRLGVTEVGDINTRPTFRGRHRRILFLFSDLVIVSKERRKNEYQYRNSFSLLNVLAIEFETHYFKFGVQLRCPLERSVKFQFNCDCKADREELMGRLEEAMAELTLMENERMAELGTSIVGGGGGSQEADSAHHQRSRLASGAGDLLSSTNLNIDLPSSKDGNYVHGVGDLAVSSKSSDLRMRSFSYNREPTADIKRVSGDSGIDSQQQSPTPTPSPSPTEGPRFTPSPAPSVTPPPAPSSSSTPSHTHSHSSPSTPHHLLSPRATTISTSRSSDTIRTLSVTPTHSASVSEHHPPPRSPSAELFRKRGSSASSEKKKSKKSRKARIGGIFGKKAPSQSPPSTKRQSTGSERSTSPFGVTQSMEL